MIFLVLLLVMQNNIVTASFEKYGEWHLANDRDEKGNTALHRFACQCDQFTDNKEIFEILNNYKLDTAGHLPNPFIKNNEGLDAASIAFDKVCSNQDNSIESCLLIGYILQYVKKGYRQGVYDTEPGSNSEINWKYWREHEEERIAREQEKLQQQNNKQ